MKKGKKKNKLFSIIIPFYNSKNTIRDTLLSATNQTYKEIEIIVINDGSNDGSEKEIEDIVLQDHRIKYIKKNNGGLSSARNAGLEKATGDYIAFLDGDDIISENFITNVKKAINAFENLDMILFPYIRNTGLLNRSEIDVYIENYNKDINETLARIKGGVCNIVFRKNIISNIRFKEGVICEDVLFVSDVLEKKDITTYYIETPMYYYRVNSGSITRSPLKIKDKTAVDVYEEIYRRNKKNRVTDKTLISYRSLLVCKFNMINKAAINGYENNESKTYFEPLFNEYRKEIIQNIVALLKNNRINLTDRIQMCFVCVSWKAFIFLKSNVIKIYRRTSH